MKMLQAETSSMCFLFTESRYRTSENPLLFALPSAFRTYRGTRKDDIIDNIVSRLASLIYVTTSSLVPLHTRSRSFTNYN